jgi:hypothetical protein
MGALGEEAMNEMVQSNELSRPMLESKLDEAAYTHVISMAHAINS